MQRVLSDISTNEEGSFPIHDSFDIHNQRNKKIAIKIQAEIMKLEKMKAKAQKDQPN